MCVITCQRMISDPLAIFANLHTARLQRLCDPFYMQQMQSAMMIQRLNSILGTKRAIK